MVEAARELQGKSIALSQSKVDGKTEKGFVVAGRRVKWSRALTGVKGHLRDINNT